MKGKTLQKITVIIAAFIMLLAALLPSMGTGATMAYAVNNTIATSNVLDDLDGATIEGKKFDKSDYRFTGTKKTTLIAFIEHGYLKNGNVGRNPPEYYVYVYNPRKLDIFAASTSNKIYMRYGVSGKYIEYPLIFVNASSEAGYEGMFYKFRVNVLGGSDKGSSIKGNTSIARETRTYEVSSIDLRTRGASNATAYTVGKTYVFRGNEKDETLQCDVSTLETLSLDVHPTFYRPNGTNGKNDFTQDSLHSVYFAVPNTYINRYGDMSAVHARWLDAVLAPMLVTGNQDAYDAILPYLGTSIGRGLEDLIYTYAGIVETNRISGIRFTKYDYIYNSNDIYGNDGSVSFGYKQVVSEQEYIDTLHMMFYAGAGVDSADTYTVPSDTILERMAEYTEEHGGELVNETYSRALFSSVSEEFTEVNLRSDETFSLTKQNIDQKWWDKLFGLTGSVTTATYDGIRAIYPVTPKDMTGTPEEVCERLYISQSDYAAFKAFFELNKATSTVYLFRYQVSDYVSQEATLIKNNGHKYFGYETVDTNAYFFQETVNLDFRIIDVSFTNDQGETVIPVSMSPIDIVHDGTNPVYTESDESFWDKFGKWAQLIFALILLIVVLVIFAPFLPYVLRLVILVVTLPVKFVKWLVNLFRRKKE